MRVVVAGGGTAGHIEPALNLADELRRRNPETEVLALGTQRGLEVTLVPARGYQLATIPPVPLPRRIGTDLVTLPRRLRTAIAQTRKIILDFQADVVVGFGGYVSIPAYLAARGHVPIVVHEANAKAGLANKVGARFADAIAESFSGSLPGAQLTGNPLRKVIAEFDRSALHDRARKEFGITGDRPVVLVFGGSLGAASLNNFVKEFLATPQSEQVVILHSHGAKNSPAAEQSERYIPLAYIERMELAYAAADFVVCRSGAMTVAEVTAAGLPACFVPLAHGNGEQSLNARPVVDAGGGLMIADAQFSAAQFISQVLPLLKNPSQCNSMAIKSKSLGLPNAAALLADMVEQVKAGA